MQPPRCSRRLCALALSALLASCQPSRPDPEQADAPATEVAVAVETPMPAEDPADKRSNLVLVVIDTIRVDHMSLYGYAKSTTPHLSRLAADGVTFDQAIAHVPQTLPSVATLLTSTYPHEHGARTNGGVRLPTETATLAEVLRDAGYRTAAVVSSFPLDRRFGVAQGFDFYDADFTGSILAEKRRESVDRKLRRFPNVEQRADEATAKALAWLDTRQRSADGDPFFLMVHYFDPHYPYAPPSKFLGALSAYEGEIAFADREIGRLVIGLDVLGLRENTLVVVTGDHGEIVGVGHEGQVADGVLRVPLVMRQPGRLPEGARVAAQVGLLDLAPTILEILEVPAPESFRGASLLPLIRGESAEGRPWTYFETLYGSLEKRRGLARYGFRSSDFKYVLNIRERQGEKTRIEELYDLRSDPGQRVNLLAGGDGTGRHADLVESLRSRTTSFMADSEAGTSMTLTPEIRAKLESLGYLLKRSRPRADPPKRRGSGVRRKRRSARDALPRLDPRSARPAEAVLEARERDDPQQQRHAEQQRVGRVGPDGTEGDLGEADGAGEGRSDDDEDPEGEAHDL